MTREEFETLNREVGDDMLLLEEYPPEVQKLHAEYLTANSRRRKRIESELWKQHNVMLLDVSSRSNTVIPYLVDYSGKDLSFNEEERQRIKDNHYSVTTQQTSVTFSSAEEEAIEDAAKLLGLRPTAFVTQAAYLIADYVLKAEGLTLEAFLRQVRAQGPIDAASLETYAEQIDCSAPFEPTQTLGEISDLLYAVHALRDTQLFTADEIRSLGLNSEQGEKLGILLAQKQAGVQGVKKTVSGGEQTA